MTVSDHFRAIGLDRTAWELTVVASMIDTNVRVVRELTILPDQTNDPLPGPPAA